MKYLLIIFYFAGSVNVFTQTDWEKWKKEEIQYTIESNYRQRDYSYNSDVLDDVVLKTFANIYWIFFSDLDGDNCPFSPSCSSFLIESVKETNVLQGTLMFFDRFTRDSNFYNRLNRYPEIKGGRFYDPPELYTLNKDKINYIPPGTIVDYD